MTATGNAVSVSGISPTPTFTAFGQDPSSNDAGVTAFSGTTTAGQGVFETNGVSTNGVSPVVAVNCNFFGGPRQFGDNVEINDTGQLLAQDLVPDSPPATFLRVWNTPNTSCGQANNWTVIASGPRPSSVPPPTTVTAQITKGSTAVTGTFPLSVQTGMGVTGAGIPAATTVAVNSATSVTLSQPATASGNVPLAFFSQARFEAVQSDAAINSTGTVAFSDLRTATQLQLSETEPGTTTPFASVQLPGLGHPVMDDRGDVLVNAGGDTAAPIRLYGPGLSAPTDIACVASSASCLAPGFTALGLNPGMSSENGQIVAFYGDLESGPYAATLGTGPGIFASIASSGTRFLVRVAAAGTGQPFASFSAYTPVAVNSTQRIQNAVTIAFLATGSDEKLGLYSVRLQLIGTPAGSGLTTPAGQEATYTSAQAGTPQPILEDGATIPGTNVTATGLSIGQMAVNNRGLGDIVFWAQGVNTQTGAIQQFILRYRICPPSNYAPANQAAVQYINQYDAGPAAVPPLPPYL